MGLIQIVLVRKTTGHYYGLMISGNELVIVEYSNIIRQITR